MDGKAGGAAHAPAAPSVAVPPRKRPWLRVVRSLVSIALLAWVLRATLRYEGMDSLGGRLLDLELGWLLVACALPCVAVIMGVLRWRVLLHEEGVTLPLPWLTRHTFIGRFVGAFTPSTTGLDGYRVMAVTKHTGSALSPSRALVLEKVAGLAGLATVTALCAALGVTGVSRATVWLGVLLALLCATAGYLLVRRPARMAALVPNVGPLKRLRKMLLDIAGSTASRRALVVALAYGLLSHAATAAVFVGSAWAVRVDLTFAALFGLGNAIVIATLLPLSAGGVGVREYVAVQVLGAMGVASGPALLVAVVGYLGGQVPAIIGGLLAAFARDDARKG